jgi:hypothetical protein
MYEPFYERLVGCHIVLLELTINFVNNLILGEMSCFLLPILLEMEKYLPAKERKSR